MTMKVGSKGQVVIEKAIRDRLGVRPGWISLQRIEDDHVVLHFLPPEHNTSLKGSLAPYIKTRVPPGRAWEEGRERAWAKALREELEETEPEE